MSAEAVPAESLPVGAMAPDHPMAMLGRDVLVRTYSAGVHVGTLVHRAGSEVVLGNARRIWRWRGANTLHELALRGASLEEFTRISEPVEKILLTEAIEVIPLTAAAAANLRVARWLRD